MGRQSDNSSISFFEDSGYLGNSFNIQLRKTITRELLGRPKHKEIVDLGCGNGEVSMWLAEYNNLTLVDGARSMVEAAKSKAEQLIFRSNIHVIQSSIFDFHANKPSDIVLCMGVVAHVQETVELLNFLNGLLIEDGVLIIQSSDSGHSLYKDTSKEKDLKSYGYQLQRFERSKFEKILNESGFQIEETRSYQWTFNPIHFLPQGLQTVTLNLMRKSGFFRRYESEYIYKCIKK